jgi:hypothetical protein
VLELNYCSLTGGRSLEISMVSAGEAQDGKDRAMWVFDGEEWTRDDGGVESTVTPETKRPRYDEHMPELQVVEIVPVPVKNRNQPLPPLPTT